MLIKSSNPEHISTIIARVMTNLRPGEVGYESNIDPEGPFHSAGRSRRERQLPRVPGPGISKNRLYPTKR